MEDTPQQRQRLHCRSRSPQHGDDGGQGHEAEQSPERPQRKRQHLQDFMDSQVLMLQELRSATAGVNAISEELRTDREAAAAAAGTVAPQPQLLLPPTPGAPTAAPEEGRWARRHRQQRRSQDLQALKSLFRDMPAWARAEDEVSDDEGLVVAARTHGGNGARDAVSREELRAIQLKNEGRDVFEGRFHTPAGLVDGIFDLLAVDRNGRASVSEFIEAFLELHDSFSVRHRKAKRTQHTSRTCAAIERAFPESRPVIEPLYPYNSQDLPEVEIAVKVYHLSNVDTSEMKFQADFVIFMDWVDPRIPEGHTSDELDFDTVFFNPHIHIENGCSDSTWVFDKAGDSVRFHSGPFSNEQLAWCTRDGKACQWCSKTIRYRGGLSIPQVDLRAFPFDYQILPIEIKMQRVFLAHMEDKNKRVACRVAEPRIRTHMKEYEYYSHEAMFRSCGSYCSPTADCISEFQLWGITCFPLISHAGERHDKYEVALFVRRPVFGVHLLDFVVLFTLSIISICSFWDAAAPELSSSMSITLTIVLTFAAYTSTRPPAIEKVPRLTFQDSFEYYCMGLVVVVVIPVNVFSSIFCGGENEEAPGFMQERYLRHSDSVCKEYALALRQIDFYGMLLFVVILILGAFGLLFHVRVLRQLTVRQRIANHIRQLELDEAKRGTHATRAKKYGPGEAQALEKAVEERTRLIFEAIEDERRRSDILFQRDAPQTRVIPTGFL